MISMQVIFLGPPPCGSANAVPEGGGQQGVGFWGFFHKSLRGLKIPGLSSGPNLSFARAAPLFQKFLAFFPNDVYNVGEQKDFSKNPRFIMTEMSAQKKPGISFSRNRRAMQKEIRRIALEIAKKFDPEKIILFGSHAAGKADADSDIDLMIIIDSAISSVDMAVKISLSVRHNFPLDILVKTPAEVNKRLESGDFFVRQILKEGVVLYERSRKRVDRKS